MFEDVISESKWSYRQPLRHKWMRPNFVPAWQVDEYRVRVTEVIDPYRGIDKDHWLTFRRREVMLAVRSEPPRAARWHVFSTLTRVSRPVCGSLVCSVVPISPWALAMKSSLSVTVVRTVPPVPEISSGDVDAGASTM